MNGAFGIRIADDRGYIDNVELHQGTIISPRGLTLAPGMSVSIVGFNAGSSFHANEIDTPYVDTGPAPVSVYYGPGYWYPGYAYGYGPSFALGFVAGGVVAAVAFTAHPCYSWTAVGPVYGHTYVAYNRGVWIQNAHTGSYTDERTVTTPHGGTYSSQNSYANGQHTHTWSGTTAAGKTASGSWTGRRRRIR